MNVAALIPARAGSTRVPNKNTRLLGGKPVVQWTLDIAKQCFSQIVVSTDDEFVQELALHQGAIVVERPAEMATEFSPDIDWVQHALPSFAACDAFCILRPTSPFRTVEKVKEALRLFEEHSDGDAGLYLGIYDSLRAVRLVTEHPNKMWRVGPSGSTMHPLIVSAQLWNEPYQVLPEFYVQTSSLEIAHVHVLGRDSISGEVICPFVVEGWEGFSIDSEQDWLAATIHVTGITPCLH